LVSTAEDVPGTPRPLEQKASVHVRAGSDAGIGQGRHTAEVGNGPRLSRGVEAGETLVEVFEQVVGVF
jgi:hypothetical protein